MVIIWWSDDDVIVVRGDMVRKKMRRKGKAELSTFFFLAPSFPCWRSQEPHYHHRARISLKCLLPRPCRVPYVISTSKMLSKTFWVLSVTPCGPPTTLPLSLACWLFRLTLSFRSFANFLGTNLLLKTVDLQRTNSLLCIICCYFSSSGGLNGRTLPCHQPLVIVCSSWIQKACGWHR